MNIGQKEKVTQTATDESWVTATENISQSLTSDSYPSKDKFSCVTNDSELQALKLELDQVRSQLAVANQESKMALLDKQLLMHLKVKKLVLKQLQN